MSIDVDNQQRDEHLKALLSPIKFEPISQGAEALIYIAERHPYMENIGKCIIKYRPPKNYRHPVLDKRLTKQRTLAESRILRKLTSINLSVPKLYFVDPANGLIWLELIHGSSIKEWIWEVEKTENSENLINSVLLNVGKCIAKVHLSDTVHGDLTTSNVLLKDGTLEPVLIDFGLASQSGLAEDKAVDLYVLERAIQSTHPVNSEWYNRQLLIGYQQEYEESTEKSAAKSLRETLNRLEQVRMRGRKRSMVG